VAGAIETIAPPLLVGLAIALVATPLVRAAARRQGLLDHPNPRSSHRTVTPRGGGLAVLLGMAGALAFLPGRWTASPAVLGLLAGAVLVALVGLLDDRFGLHPLPRFLCHLAAAGALVAGAGGLGRLPLPAPLDVPTGPLAVPLAVLWVVAVLNFTNFMDGIDGLAGLQGAVTALGLALAGIAPSATLVAAALAGGCAGFLPYNWMPARIFLGDIGSGLVGYTVASIPLLAPAETRPQAVMLAGTSLWLFLADASTCLLGRMAAGERWYEAHRRHLYQRRVAAGATHERVAVEIGVGSVAMTALALHAWHTGDPSPAWAALLLGLVLFWLERRMVIRAERRAPGPREGDAFTRSTE
jgi:Fuc2NAc and GlcNAc transferase